MQGFFYFLYALVKLLIFSTHSRNIFGIHLKKSQYPLFISSFLFLINVLFLLFSRNHMFLFL